MQHTHCLVLFVVVYCRRSPNTMENKVRARTLRFMFTTITFAMSVVWNKRTMYVLCMPLMAFYSAATTAAVVAAADTYLWDVSLCIFYVLQKSIRLVWQSHGQYYTCEHPVGVCALGIVYGERSSQAKLENVEYFSRSRPPSPPTTTVDVLHTISIWIWKRKKKTENKNSFSLRRFFSGSFRFAILLFMREHFVCNSYVLRKM